MFFYQGLSVNRGRLRKVNTGRELSCGTSSTIQTVVDDLDAWIDSWIDARIDEF